MIPRYTRQEIGEVWSQQRKLECWLEVELAATEAWAEEGAVPARGRRGGAGERRLHGRGGRTSASGSPTTTSPPSSTSSPASVGEHGRWIHYGLTSSDVLDTALALQLRQAGEIVLACGARLPRRAGRAGAGAARHALRRPHPRRPRRADDLRPAPRRLRLRGRPQPRPPHRRLRAARASASSPARSAPTPRCRRRSRRG